MSFITDSFFKINDILVLNTVFTCPLLASVVMKAPLEVSVAIAHFKITEIIYHLVCTVGENIGHMK